MWVRLNDLYVRMQVHKICFIQSLSHRKMFLILYSSKPKILILKQY